VLSTELRCYYVSIGHLMLLDQTRHVVHGHHDFRDGPVTIEGRTNLDTQAWYTGRLAIGVFDDEVAGGPVSLLEVHGEALESKKEVS